MAVAGDVVVGVVGVVGVGEDKVGFGRIEMDGDELEDKDPSSPWANFGTA